jgi:hypothetical protein
MIIFALLFALGLVAGAALALGVLVVYVLKA